MLNYLKIFLKMQKRSHELNGPEARGIVLLVLCLPIFYKVFLLASVYSKLQKLEFIVFLGLNGLFSYILLGAFINLLSIWPNYPFTSYLFAVIFLSISVTPTLF